MRRLDRVLLAIVALAVAMVAGCGRLKPSPTLSPVSSRASPPPPEDLRTATSHGLGTPSVSAPPHSEGRVDGLSEDQVATLASLEQIDDGELYVMRVHGMYDESTPSAGEGKDAVVRPGAIRASTWACSLFAALGDPDNMLYGRNFDWRYSPAVLLFADPPDGYASVSMVDIAYLGFEDDVVRRLTSLPLVERQALLYTPFMPFDGMNEHGLVVGMAAVPESEMPHDSGKEIIDSLEVMREMLDHARDIDEAVGILQRYNIDWGGGPPLHYLLADASGHAILVEFYQGQMVLLLGRSSRCPAGTRPPWVGIWRPIS